MSRLVWATDLHLNFVPARRRREFYHQLQRPDPDAILLGGDIGEADSVGDYLSEMAGSLGVPIYFVLGNHDFYGGSIQSVRERIARQARTSRDLVWLPAAGVVKLSDTTALVGHDSWGDGRLGRGPRSEALLNDFVLIEELRRAASKTELFRRLNELGDEARRQLQGVLEEALRSFRKILLLTHVPPFRAACWHAGGISDDDFLPHFTCKAVGDMLLEVMRPCSDRSLEVLCGHTHSSGEAWIEENIFVRTGSAEYGRPAVQAVLEV